MTACPSRKPGFMTRAIHYGFDRTRAEAALNPPIYLSSTYAFETAAESEMIAAGQIRRPLILETRLAELEGAEACTVFAAGMGAIGVSPSASKIPTTSSTTFARPSNPFRRAHERSVMRHLTPHAPPRPTGLNPKPLTKPEQNDMEWWQCGIVYQVYPRSFQDSDGDGTGDLRGIIDRLEYLAWLGVDAVWLSPVYPSPMADFGYDVADYCAIDPLFGTLADFDALLARAHALGLKLILDFVPNHTSDQHEWFQASRHRRDNKADWYLWHDPAAVGGPPNNWLANFGGSAWTYDPIRAQFYYHSFLPEQPDLNWRNPDVRQAMYDALRFWLDRGVDGFRVDVLWMMIKDDRYRDNPPNPDWHPGQRPFKSLLPLYTADRPEVHDIVAQMRAVLDEFDHRLLIGEIYLPIDRLVTYYGRDGKGAQLPFNFHLLLLQDWSAVSLAHLINHYETALPPGAWPNWVLANHDRKRVASRLGPAQARIAAMLLLTLRGTPTIYMGEELGMLDTSIPPDAVRDPAELRQPGHGEGRDPERTPFPWDDTKGHGFTTGTPWLPFGADTPLSRQRDDDHSMLSLYRRLIALRRQHPALAIGEIGSVTAQGPILTYDRSLDGARFMIALNVGDTESSIDASAGAVLADTLEPKPYDHPAGTLRLRPHQGLLLRL